MKGEGSKGGWIPVFRRKAWPNRASQGIHTIFVDNLPESLTPKGLFNLFSKFGVVMDVYIPNKRRKLTSSRFGFVRYNCSVAAGVAVQKANGTWCDNREIKVKMAEFSKNQDKIGNQQVFQRRVGTAVQSNRVDTNRLHVNGPSYAEVVANRVGNVKGSGLIVKVQEYGNNWLYGSLVAKLKPCCLVSDFKYEVFNKCGLEVQIREIGYKSVILTFNSEEEMRCISKDLEHWVHEWCESIKQWTKDILIEQDREVWLSCYGVPFHLWNSANFKNIGMLWGDVTEIDRATLDMSSLCCAKIRIATKAMNCINQVITLDCKGKLYHIRVCEEQIVVMQNPSSSVNPLRNVSSDSINRGVEHCVDNGVPLREDDDDVAIGDDLERVVDRCSPSQKNEAALADKDSLLAISVIHETASGLGMINAGCTCIRKQAQLTDYNCLNDDGRNSKFDGHVATSGFLKSLSGPPSSQPNVNLEVFLGPVLLDNPKHSRTQPILGLNEVGLVSSIEPINSGLQISLVHNEVGLVRSGAVTHSGLQASHAHPPILQSVERNCRNPKLKGKVSEAEEIRAYQHSVKKRTGKASRGVKAMAIGGNQSKKEVLFRAASQALSDSISLTTSSSKGRYLLNEAQATLQIGKLLGLTDEGNDIDIVQQIMELENQDLVRREQLDTAKRP